MLYHTGVKIPYRAIDWGSRRVESGVAQLAVPRHQTAHARNRQASLPILVLNLSDRRQLGVDEHRVGHRLRFRIAWTLVETEYHHPQTDSNLRCGEPRAIEIPHGLPH